jgi:hypothetical protein
MIEDPVALGTPDGVQAQPQEKICNALKVGFE